MTPPLTEATLQAGEVASLLRDVEALGADLTVRVKRAATSYADAAPLTTADVPPALSAGCAVQLRYRFSGEAYVDTLLPLPTGAVRLFRATQ